MTISLYLEANLGVTGLANVGFTIYGGASVLNARTEVGVTERGATGVYFHTAVVVDPKLATAAHWDDDPTTPTIEASEDLAPLIRASELWQLQGLDDANAMTVTPTARNAGGVAQVISGDGETTTTVTRS